MKNPVKLACCSLMMLATHSMIVNAADTSTINITGNVVASPCVIDSSNATLSISLGDIQATALQAAGTGSDWVSFSIVLKNCPASTTKLNAAFSGTPDGSDATRYKNTGTATNLSVELTGGGGLNFGNAQNIPLSGVSSTTTFSMRARAYSKGNVMPGSINTSVVVSFTYQ